MEAVEDMTREELIGVIRGLKARVGELEGAEIHRRLTILEHPATIEAFMENIPDAVALVAAPVGDLKMISRYALEFFEIKKKAVQGMTLPQFLSEWEMLNPDGSSIDKCPTMASLRDGLATVNREIVFRKNGRKKTVLVNSSPVIDSTGKIIGCMTVWREITARKEAEEEIWREKEVLKQILEIMPVGVWILGNNGEVIEGNRTVREIWGGAESVRKEFGEYKAWWAETGKQVGVDQWAGLRAIRKGELTINEELEIEGFDGKRRVILNSAMPLTQDGHIIGAIAVNQDITERKKIEKVIKESEQALAEAQRIARMGNWTWEVGFDRFYGSAETYNIFEIPQGTPINSEEFLRMVHEEDRPMVRNAMEDGLNGASYTVDFRVVTGKGKIKCLQAIGELIHNGQTSVLKGIVQDITERKEQENKQKKLMSELQEAFARIKTLSGLIPICANCKRIRDDRGYWQRMERYIEERSQAEFTHSLCPDCEQKLYGSEKEK